MTHGCSMTERNWCRKNSTGWQGTWGSNL